MKNLKYLLVSLVLIALTGCGDYFFDNKLDHETVITEKRNFEYKLADADYATIAKSKEAQAIAKELDAKAGEGSKVYTEALTNVGKNKCFNAEAIAKEYMTFLLAPMYPELNEGSICKVTYKDGDNEVYSYFELTKGVWVLSIYYQETFAKGQGDFKIVDANLGKLFAVWVKGSGCMNANGYKGKGTESWLISPEIEVPVYAEKPVLIFEHSQEYPRKFDEDCQVYLTESNYTEGIPDIENDWKLLEYTKDAPGTSFVSSEEFDLSIYKTKKIRIAFRYRSYDDAISWKIRNFAIRESKGK